MDGNCSRLARSLGQLGMEEEGEEAGWDVWLVGGDVTPPSWFLAALSPSVAMLFGKGQGGVAIFSSPVSLPSSADLWVPG